LRESKLNCSDFSNSTTELVVFTKKELGQKQQSCVLKRVVYQKKPKKIKKKQTGQNWSKINLI
jgi:hypothetical protein